MNVETWVIALLLYATAAVIGTILFISILPPDEHDYEEDEL